MDPAATYAVVVGIERYDAGWPLNGPARDAMRIAAWLRAAGVPANQIFLVVAALPENQDSADHEAARLGIEMHTPADREDILTLFTRKLTKVTGQHLVVYWSGHGTVDEKGGRVLFTADADANDKRNIHLPDLLDYLKDKEVRGFLNQVVIVDACANYVEDMRSRTVLPKATFPGSRARKQGVQQFVLYAAAQGQTAGNNQTERYGDFTEVVLGQLHGANGPQWPPNMNALSTKVAETFEGLRTQGKSRQTPVFLSGIDWNGNEFEHDYGGLPVSGRAQQATAEAGLTTSQVRRLASALADSPFAIDASEFMQALEQGSLEQLFADLVERAGGEDELLALEQVKHLSHRQLRIAEPLRHFSQISAKQARSYYDVVPDRQLAPRLLELDEVLEHLAEFGELDERAPLLRFVARLEILTGNRLTSKWFRLSPASLKRLRAFEQTAMAAHSGSHLVLDLRVPGSPTPTWPTSLVGHLRSPDGQWSKETFACAGTESGVRAAVNELITWAHERESDDQQSLGLGFLAPRVRFDDVPESWTYVDEFSDGVPLREEYPVVLHSGDRLGVPRAQARWRGRAQRIAADLDAADPEIIWIEAAQDPKTINRLIREANAACVVFSYLPGPLRGPLPADPLVAAINPGAPYVIWLDEEPGDWDSARAAITTLVNKGQFDQVPVRTMEIRRNCEHVLHGLAIRVLWDKRELLPEFGLLTGIDTRTA
jgi:hypothetical protein